MSLAGLGIVGMIHTFRNLHDLVITPGRPEPVFAGETNIPLGLPEQPLGSIVIKSVQPKFAVGEVRENAGKRIRTGDIARYDEPQPRPPAPQTEE